MGHTAGSPGICRAVACWGGRRSRCAFSCRLGAHQSGRASARSARGASQGLHREAVERVVAHLSEAVVGLRDGDRPKRCSRQRACDVTNLLT